MAPPLCSSCTISFCVSIISYKKFTWVDEKVPHDSIFCPMEMDFRLPDSFCKIFNYLKAKFTCWYGIHSALIGLTCIVPVGFGLAKTNLSKQQTVSMQSLSVRLETKAKRCNSANRRDINMIYWTNKEIHEVVKFINTKTQANKYIKL